MENLPNEILTSIFQYLPQKYILILSTVCQKWNNIILQTLSLNTLHIYSVHQLKEYITVVTSKPSIRNHINHLYFHISKKIKEDILIDIINAFPNLHSIQHMKPFFSPNKSTIRIHISSINQIEYFPFWYNGYNEQWMNLLSNSQHKLKSLSFFLKPKLLVLDTNQQYSTPPILYFTPISPIKGTIYEYSFYTDSEHKIYTVKLPVLSSLTHLNIDCMDRDGDERMFESIHQSCPQLTSLTLTSFHMHTSEDYNHKINNQLLKPYTLLKELSIGDLLNDPECFDYLSFKYPYLETLTLILGPKHNSHTSNSSYKLAIYHMVTQYPFLKKLNVSLESGTYQNELWPHDEFIQWLNNHSKQLIHLKYLFDFKSKIVNGNGDVFQIEPRMISASSSPEINGRFIFQPQQINYLNHLSSLSIGSKRSNTIHILYYFYLCNEKKESSYLSYSIEELNLGDGHHGNIYFWLTAFPNLKALTISGPDKLKVITDYDIDEYDDMHYYSTLNLKFEEIYPLLNRKMKQQKELITHPTTTTAEATLSNIDHPYYKLKKIAMKRCVVDFRKFGWDTFFKRCPHLRTISLSNINPWIKSYARDTIKVPLQHATIDLSHLSLELLKIHNFIYVIHFSEHRQLHLVEQLCLKNILSDNSFYVVYDSEMKNNTYDDNPVFTLNIIYKQIDSIVFDQTK
ncbi:unnamed protein product [Cunninghamella blakesleeana]